MTEVDANYVSGRRHVKAVSHTRATAEDESTRERVQATD
jgi:hypothetical protein